MRAGMARRVPRVFPKKSPCDRAQAFGVGHHRPTSEQLLRVANERRHRLVEWRPPVEIWQPVLLERVSQFLPSACVETVPIGIRLVAGVARFSELSPGQLARGEEDDR